MSEARRGILARIGIAALNLWAPGLGLLRTGPLRKAVFFLAVYLGGLALLLAYLFIAPIPSFGAYAALLVVAATFGLALLVWSVLLTWRGSRDRGAPVFWSRWY